MFRLETLPRFRLLSSKTPSVRSFGSYVHMKIGNKHISFDGDDWLDYLKKIYWGMYGISFTGLFLANTGIGVYESAVIEKPFGDNCPLRNGLVGLAGGAAYGLIKGISYSFGNIFFWSNAWYEHKNSNIVQTQFGKMRERDIRLHLIPGANETKKSVINGYMGFDDTKNNAKLLDNLGVLNYNRRSYGGY